MADSAITIGVALLILDILRSPHAERARPAGMTEMASSAGRTD